MRKDVRNSREWLEMEMEIDMLRLQSCRELAEELVLGRGWTKNDEDFWMQVHDEEKRLWDEQTEQEMYRHGWQLAMEEEEERNSASP